MAEALRSDFSLRRLVRTAILLRMSLAIVLHLFVPEQLFAPDQTTYHTVGARIADYWTGETLVLPTQLAPSRGPVGYFYVVAVLYTLFGKLALMPKLLNALLGGWTVALTHDVALRVTGSVAAANRTATLTAYFPSLILWSALNIRDAWMILLIVLICREALVLQERVSLRALVLLGAAVWGITQFRSYVFVPAAGPMVVSFLVRQRQHLARNVFLGMLAAFVVIYVDQATGAQHRFRTIDLEEIQSVRYWNTVGAASGFEAQADISTPVKAAAFLPVGLAYFLLAPFPWMIGSVRQVLAMPETLFFYSLIPSMLGGVRRLIRDRLSDALMILLITGGLTLGYALGEGNAGTAYRHRAQILSFYLMFAATGIEARRAARSPTPLSDPA